MTHDRFADMATADRLPEAPSGFMMVPVAACQTPPTPLEWLYQQMYERAQRAHEQPKTQTRELFGIMN
jgi:hypothetical protein